MIEFSGPLPPAMAGQSSISETAASVAAAGYRGASNTAQGGTLNNIGSNGICWSSSVNGANGYNLNFNSSNVNPSNSNVRAFGFSVRPCQELITRWTC